jgi:DNA-binding protein HU-beta
MNKARLIEKISQKVGLSKGESLEILSDLTSIIAKTLKRGERVVIPGFGTFLISRRSAREGRNPHTGEKLALKATQTPRFRAGKEFKKLLN